MSQLEVDNLDKSQLFDDRRIRLSWPGLKELVHAAIEFANLKTYTLILSSQINVNEVTQFLEENRVIRYGIFSSDVAEKRGIKSSEGNITLTLITTARKHDLVAKFLKDKNLLASNQ